MNIVSGGKTVAGASLGMLVLQSNFPRISGDGANAQTWPFPVLYKVVGGATPARVVLQNAEGLVDAFAGAANELVAAGADGITTSCGFLILHQQTLASACQVPVATSSLMQVSAVQALLPPGRRVGVVTISRQALTPQHLANAGAPLDTPIEGTEGGEFTRAILGDELSMDVDAARNDVLAAGRRLLARHPEVGALVLECTNMPPYAAELSQALGLPVFDFYSFVTWFHTGLRPRRFAQP